MDLELGPAVDTLTFGECKVNVIKRVQSENNAGILWRQGLDQGENNR